MAVNHQAALSAAHAAAAQAQQAAREAREAHAAATARAAQNAQELQEAREAQTQLANQAAEALQAAQEARAAAQQAHNAQVAQAVQSAQALQAAQDAQTQARAAADAAAGNPNVAGGNAGYFAHPQANGQRFRPPAPAGVIRAPQVQGAGRGQMLQNGGGNGIGGFAAPNIGFQPQTFAGNQIDWNQRLGDVNEPAWHTVPFAAGWEVPPQAQVMATYGEIDFAKKWRHGELDKFKGQPIMYEAFKRDFLPTVHYQSGTAALKVKILDSLVTTEIRDSLFYGLTNSLEDYQERIKRLEGRYGGPEKVHLYIRTELSKIANGGGGIVMLRKMTFIVDYYLRHPPR